jgi:ankyrin repeat protein
MACRLGLKDIVNSLLARGSDVNARDNQGNTPSYWAKAYQHYELCNHLTIFFNVSGSATPALDYLDRRSVRV